MSDINFNIVEESIVFDITSENINFSITDQTLVFEDVKSKVQVLKKSEVKRARHKSIMHSKPVKSYLEKWHKDFVLVPTDKASNNLAVVCKKFYIQQSLKELGIFKILHQIRKRMVLI